MGYLEGIENQPRNLEMSARGVLSALEREDVSAFRADPLVLTGIGSSYFAASHGAWALRAAGRAAFALSSTDLLDPGAGDAAAALVGISQSGRSAETVGAFERASVPRLAVANAPSGPLQRLADVVVPLESADDHSFATQTYTATLFAMAALAGRLGGHDRFAVAELVATVEEVLERTASFADEGAALLDGARFVDFVGRGASFASAAQGALLLREVVRLPAAHMDTLQYLHGSVEVAGRGLGCVVFGSGREIRLARDLASYGTAVLLVTTEEVKGAENLLVFKVPEAEPVLLPILEILPVQLLTHRLAQAKGIPADGFRYEQDDTKLEI